MKLSHPNDSAVDYSAMFPPNSLESFNWNIPHHQPHHQSEATPSPQPTTIASAGTTPCISPHTSTVDSPTSTITTPSVLPPHDVALHMPLCAPQAPVVALKTSATSKVQSRAAIVKPSPAEEDLVRCIHRKVGGPAKLSTYEDPAKVRHVVIEALAKEQLTSDEAMRIRKGQLSVFERRVVRTVTNRGAAVRSRMRQRKEMAHLRHQLNLRDSRVSHLESVVRALCSAYAVPLPPTITDRAAPTDAYGQNGYSVDGVTMTSPTSIAKTEATMTGLMNLDQGMHGVHGVHAHHTQTQSQTQLVHERVAHDMPTAAHESTDLACNQQMFGSLVDHVVSHVPWS